MVEDDIFDIFDTFNLPNTSVPQPCNHTGKERFRGISICIDCGEEFPDDFDTEKECKFLKASESNGRQVRRVYDKSIYKDIESFDIPHDIQLKANEYYTKVSDGKIFRGQSRKAVIFSCVFVAYKKTEQPQSIERLQQLFKINKKTVSRGIKLVGMSMQDKNSKLFLNVEDIIPEILKCFDSSIVVLQEILALYAQIKNRSSTLNRSRPRSTAAALIYYYMKTKNITFSDKLFCFNVKLSKLTILKLYHEICLCVQKIENKNNQQSCEDNNKKSEQTLPCHENEQHENIPQCS